MDGNQIKNKVGDNLRIRVYNRLFGGEGEGGYYFPFNARCPAAMEDDIFKLVWRDVANEIAGDLYMEGRRVEDDYEEKVRPVPQLHQRRLLV